MIAIVILAAVESVNRKLVPRGAFLAAAAVCCRATRKRLFVRLTRVSFGAVAVAGFVGGGKIVTVIEGPPLVLSSMSTLLSDSV